MPVRPVATKGDVGGRRSLLEYLAAHDLAVRDILRNDIGDLETPPGDARWLDQLGLLRAGISPSNKEKPAEEAVDDVLAVYEV